MEWDCLLNILMKLAIVLTTSAPALDMTVILKKVFKYSIRNLYISMLLGYNILKLREKRYSDLC